MKIAAKKLWFLRWLGYSCVWLLIGFLAVLVLLRQYVGWSGKRKWIAVQAMLAAEGESADFRKNTSEPVPDEQNFFAIEPLRDLPLIADNKEDKSERGLRRMRLVNAALPKDAKRPANPQGASLGRATDLQAWADWLRKDGSFAMPADSGNAARDVLAGLRKHDDLVHELAAGLNRPQSQFTPALRTRPLPENLYIMSLPHYAPLQGLTQMLCLRSIAAARAGEPATAHEALLIAVRLNQATMEEPILIGMLAGAGSSAMICNAIWEVCDAHAGSAEDFLKLQQALSRLDLRKATLAAIRGEIAGNVSMMAYLKRSRNMRAVGAAPGPGNLAVLLAFFLMPDGWFDSNAAATAGILFEYSLKPVRDGGLKAMFAKTQAFEDCLTARRARRWNYDEVVALIALPVFSSISSRPIYVQYQVNAAIAGCALERYRASYNSYPGSLAAANTVSEKAIPEDLLVGKPMGYRQTANE